MHLLAFLGMIFLVLAGIVALVAAGPVIGKQLQLSPISTIILSVIIIGSALALALAIFLPVFRGAKIASHETSCLSNVNQISKGLAMYVGDNDERLPREKWCDSILEYVANKRVFVCPNLEGSPCGYSLNKNL